MPESFGELTALTEWFLDSNQLSSWTEIFGGLMALRKLRRDNNQRSSLPESFGELASLQTVYLGMSLRIKIWFQTKLRILIA